MEMWIRRSAAVALLSLSLIVGVSCQGGRSATCTVVSGSGVGTVSGTIQLSEMSNGNVSLTITLSGMTGSSKHGFHVHANPSIGNQCNDSAGHLNVDGTSHGAPTDPQNMRHTGDLGNIVTDANGNIAATITDWLIKFDGQYSMIGKPIVIHSGEDDLGRGNWTDSKTTGHAGSRLGCCLIQLNQPAGQTKTFASTFRYSAILLFVSIVSAFYFRQLLDY